MWWVVDDSGCCGSGFVLGFLLSWVVATTMVVVVADGGCFGFFVVGYGCHSGASGGSSLWVFGGPVCVFFFSSSGGGRLQGLVAMDVVSDRSYGNNVVVVE